MIVHLFDNRDVEVTSIIFDAGEQRFYLMNEQGGPGEDITVQLTQADKLTIGGDHYDQNYDLRRASGSKNGKSYPKLGQEPSTSTGEILADQMATDPLGAPLDAAKNAVNQGTKAIADAANTAFENLSSSTGVAVGTVALIITVSAILYGFYLFKKD